MTSASTMEGAITVFSKKGTPIGGTYTTPLTNGGLGGSVSYDLDNVARHSFYYVRIDGDGGTIGAYQFLVEPVPATLTVAATSSDEFTVTRTGNPFLALSVPYKVAGTAVAGIDYSKLSGVLTIPAGQLSATLNVQPLSALKKETDKSLVLDLLDGQHYVLGRVDAATLELVGGKAV